MPGIGTVPTISDFSHSAAAPPGDVSTSSAAPCSTNSIASVTTMSGTRVTTIRMPLTAPSAKPMQQHERHDEQRDIPRWRPSIIAAAVTLVSAIIEATDRSMPPAMTTMVCAATAKA